MAPIGLLILTSHFHLVCYHLILVGALATFFEILGAFALAFGVATRFFSLSLIILTVVAIAAVHWPEHWSSLSELFKGYRIIDENEDGFGNYKLPLLYHCDVFTIII